MFSTMDNANQLDIWRGVVDFANANGIHLTAYIGTYQSDDNSVTSFLDTCFDTVSNSKGLDGVILFSGFLAQNVGLEKFHEYVKMLPEGIPAVSVSYSMPGVPTVLADGFGGIYGAVEHFIKEHGKKKIAFIKGPDGHSEAEERLAGYKKALEDNGIKYDERYVFPGVFIQESGVQAVKELLDVRKLKAEAIVASNDQMAIGALRELKKRGILVPEGVAITGFDDDAAASTSIPSLSTIQQDFFGIGRTCAENLFKTISGEAVKDVTYVPSAFVARQSCGCIEDAYSKEKAIPLFTETLVNYNIFYRELPVWKEALNILTVNGINFDGDEYATREAISTLLSATSFVYDIRAKEQKRKELTDEGVRNFIRRVTSSLILTFNIDSMIENLSTSLPSLSINTALIGVYSSPIKSADANADRSIDTLLGFDGDTTFNIKSDSLNPILFSDYSTFEEFDLDKNRRSLFFIPLFFEDEEVGVMFLPFEEHIPLDSYERLRVSVATVLKGVELLSTIQTLSVTDELTGLLNRRGFFQLAHARMKHMRRNEDTLPFVMFMDMDGLKAINDNYGHKEGDVAISAFAKTLQDSLREEDIIGRMGGDEFTVFSSVKSVEDGQRLVQRIREKLDDYNAQKRHAYIVAGSIGSVVLESATKECLETALLSADGILYAEKMEKKKKGLSRA